MRSEQGKQRQTKKFKAYGENDTRKFALELAEKLEPGDVIAVSGDLGTGKTTFTKYIAEGLGIDENIDSPTFTIVKEHRSGKLPLFHFDVYRIGSADEFFDTGGEEYFYSDGVSVIEWAENIEDALPEDAIRISIEYGDREDERIFTCTY